MGEDFDPECYLDCSGGATCPEGMQCFGGFICAVETPPLPECSPENFDLCDACPEPFDSSDYPCVIDDVFLRVNTQIVFDNSTGLLWLGAGPEYDWYEAVAQCEQAEMLGYDVAGYDNWSLPTEAQAITISPEGAQVNTTAFPGDYLGQFDQYRWTVTEVDGDTAIARSFNIGQSNPRPKTQHYRKFCVREL